jgi:hypothetical protein
MPPFTTSSWDDARRAARYWLGRNAGETRLLGPDMLGVLVVTVIWYLFSYILNDSTPSVANPGWWVWWDQGHYYQTTSDLAHGELKPSVYWFGYPVLGAPFFRLFPRHPYLIANIALTLTMVGALYAACRVYLSRLEGVLIVYVFVWFDPFLRDECLIIPWNTLPAYAAFSLCIYLLILKPGPGRLIDFKICAVVCGLAMFARPTEMLALACIYLFGLLRFKTWKEAAWAAGFLGCVGAVVAAVTFGLNYHFYQQLDSPYMGSESRKVTMTNFGLKLYQFVFDPEFLTGNGVVPPATRTVSLMTRYPEFLFIVPGALFLLRDRGWVAWGLILGIAIELGFYLCYSPFNNPPYAWSYGQWHYIGWVLPWLGFVTYLSIRQAFFRLPRLTFFSALLLPTFFACLVGFKAVPVASATAQSDEGLHLQTNFEDGLYSMNLTVLAPCDIDEIRLLFLKPPSFNGTEVANLSLMTVSVNRVDQPDMLQRSISQDGNTFHVSFLACGLKLKAGDAITIQFRVREAPELQEAQLVGVACAPAQSIRDYFQSR